MPPLTRPRFGPARATRKRIRNVAVLFADIEGCTRLCEDLRPREMNGVIERYFSRFLDVVKDEGGKVTEILGDGLLALFEGSSLRADAMRAVLAALRMQRAAAELNATRHDRHDPIVVNIGINIGPALVGMTRIRGRLGEQSVYSADGPVTNIAARLCTLARCGQILVSGTMVEYVREAYKLRALGARVLKNVSGRVEVFEVLPNEGGSELPLPSARTRTNG